ncbi:metallophosphoesterase family protein [Rhodoferax sp.]|uniref:metallophosphoesterase family protein n=1 Tax=Rhodoferax sp. TaxID=50421 RepID=UPI0019E3AC0D|nr:metallophosphoesterase family protein [Rhodoferax sp.]MBE0472581.1 metallophosphoesterase family protein [Rhodoferax sp.]
MKICIVSDSHDRAPMLASAVMSAKESGAEAVIHCGDLIGAMTLCPLLEIGLPVHVVHGNNLGDLMALSKLCAASSGLITYHGADLDIRFGARKLFATHYPHYGRAMACTGDYDIVCCGHSHVASVAQQPNIAGGKTWLVNPGSVGGLGAPATWLLADLDRFDFEVRSLP